MGLDCVCHTGKTRSEIDNIKTRLTLASERDGVGLWLEALNANTPESYNDYIKTYPNSRYLSEAKQRIDWLNTLAIGTEEAVLQFNEESSGNPLADEINEKNLGILNSRAAALINGARCTELDQLLKQYAEFDISYAVQDCEISRLISLAKTEGTAIKVYQYALKIHSSGDLEGAKKIYTAIVNELPNGDYVTESLEKLVSIRAIQDQNTKDAIKRARETVRYLQERTEQSQAEKAARAAAEAEKEEADRNARYCQYRYEAQTGRCEQGDTQCSINAQAKLSSCLKQI